MSAQGIAARMVAKHRKRGAFLRARERAERANLYFLNHAGLAGEHRKVHRLVLWRAVSTALGRMEASV